MNLFKKYYVYCYVLKNSSFNSEIMFPKNGKTILLNKTPKYIGKGIYDRANSHKEKTHNAELEKLINLDLVENVILMNELTEPEALWVEGLLLNKYKKYLVNKIYPNKSYFHYLKIEYERYKILLDMLNSSKTIKETAFKLNKSVTTIKRWINIYNLYKTDGIWKQSKSLDYVVITPDMFIKPIKKINKHTLLEELNNKRSIEKTSVFFNISLSYIKRLMSEYQIMYCGNKQWTFDSELRINYLKHKHYKKNRKWGISKLEIIEVLKNENNRKNTIEKLGVSSSSFYRLIEKYKINLSNYSSSYKKIFIEKDKILNYLEKYGTLIETADKLGIDYRTLKKLISEYNIEYKKYLIFHNENF